MRVNPKNHITSWFFYCSLLRCRLPACISRLPSTQGFDLCTTSNHSSILQAGRIFTSKHLAMSANSKDGPFTEYERLLCRLFTTNLFNAKTNGLEEMKRLHKALGSPMDNLKVIHVAGSNGKGSTCVKIANTLQLSGFRVGLFTSPHISSFRERIQINGVPVAEDAVVKYLREIFDICDKENIPSTFFEIVTALALRIFSIENVDIVVLETGLGGRLDATNIVQRPLLSIITSIGLEHTAILGDTLEKIAVEKSGIIKEGCPVLIGNNLPKDVLKKCAVERKSSAFFECDDLLGVVGTSGSTLDYDSENSRIAAAAITYLSTVLKEHNITPDVICEGVNKRPPCRFEEVIFNMDEESLNVILDVAHNPQALEQLFSKINTKYPESNARVVLGMSADKDLKTCSEIVLNFVSHADRVHLVQSSNPRAASIVSMLECNPILKLSNYDLNLPDGKEESSVTVQVKKAMELARANKELLVICGSFFILSEARACLGITEPRDRDVVSNITVNRISNKK